MKSKLAVASALLGMDAKGLGYVVSPIANEVQAFTLP